MVVLAACDAGGQSQAASGDEGLSGSIFVSGSSTVEPISLANAEKFSAEHPEVQISVEGPGTSDGFAIFCDGGSDVSDASRAIKQEEVDICAENRVEFTELEVGIDGLSVITSNADTVDCLSFLDLYALLGPESQGFASWSDANDLAAELESELGDEFGTSNAPYPDAPLDVTAPGEESGTFDSFVELVIAGIAEARGQDETTRPDYQASPDDNVIVEGIGGSDSSLGWVGYAFAVNNADVIHPIPVDGGDGCVEPTEATISDGSYPIARSLFIYPSLTALEGNTALEAFVDFYMSDDGFASVTEAGYVSLPDDRIEATRAAWDERRAGKFTD
jgi:phosphate transport system substrate-binding protein